MVAAVGGDGKSFRNRHPSDTLPSPPPHHTAARTCDSLADTAVCRRVPPSLSRLKADRDRGTKFPQNLGHFYTVVGNNSLMQQDIRFREGAKWLHL